jgi:hypothetical protein
MGGTAAPTLDSTRTERNLASRRHPRSADESPGPGNPALRLESPNRPVIFRAQGRVLPWPRSRPGSERCGTCTPPNGNPQPRKFPAPLHDFSSQTRPTPSRTTADARYCLPPATCGAVRRRASWLAPRLPSQVQSSGQSRAKQWSPRYWAQKPHVAPIVTIRYNDSVYHLLRKFTGLLS